ncbi:MAG: hypothetical protein JJE30_19295 [Desulfuromonadales bacterium]|nr:hypothetical protein [Desulfuromonadales bacterium]
MVVSFCLKSRTVRRLLCVIMICALLPSGFAWGALQPPLRKIPVPEPPNLGQFLRSGPDGKPTAAARAAAIQLGKALFWDMQAGSDGATACASCHYRAGADPVVGSFPKETARRDRNQLHPGPDTIFGNNSTVIKTFTIDPLTNLNLPLILRASARPLFAPNYLLQPFADFPLFQVLPITSRLTPDPANGFTADEVTLLRDTNDVVGSQGIRLADFLAVNSSALDSGTPLADQIFHTGATADPINNVRQVTGRNSPSVINAVFNYANFWDGRANNIFNGENPFGPLDQSAGIWIDDGAALVKQKIAIPNASLASQAVGPALSDVEMSFKGRTFPELGRKMLTLTTPPLGQQLVHSSDSVLGTLSRATLQPDGTVAGDRGLTTNYTQMIQAAFPDNLWISTRTVTLPTKAAPLPGGEQFSQMEANFSLFWGLAIQLYEATLVSDRTPFDRFQSGNRNALSPAAQRGFATFDGKCTVCHSGAEFTAAAAGSSIPNCVFPDCNPVAFTNNTTHSLIKFDINPTTFTTGLIDAGFFNIGVRTTEADQGRGGTAPFVNQLTGQNYPLSFAQLALLGVQGQLPFATPRLASVLTATDNTKGAFKTPGLRNVELTPPYFHNGDALTLDQVVEFYTRGGDFPGNPQLAAAMQPIGNLRSGAAGRIEVVEFLKALTDERVRNEWAPFDHPELLIPNGVDPVSGADDMITLTATGGAPAPVPLTVLTLNPVTTPTILTSQLLTGTVDSTATVAISVNNGTPVFASVPCIIDPLTLACTIDATPFTATWSATVTGLAVGPNSIAVTATNDTGDTLSAPVANIQVMPSATISGLPPGGRTNQNSATLTIGGAGVVSYQYRFDGGPLIVVDSVATPINLSALSDGTHSIVVHGKDAAGNQQPATLPTTGVWTVKANPPVLTLNDVSPPTGNSTQTISGTVELGSTPQVSVSTGATAGTVSTVPGAGISTWSCDISGLAGGTTTVTVIALDNLFNETTVTGVITRTRDGNFKGSGVTDISDALKALRFAVGLELPTTTDMIHGDVAPLANGLPTQNNLIDIADALLILRKTVGLVTF